MPVIGPESCEATGGARTQTEWLVVSADSPSTRPRQTSPAATEKPVHPCRKPPGEFPAMRSGFSAEGIQLFDVIPRSGWNPIGQRCTSGE